MFWKLTGIASLFAIALYSHVRTIEAVFAALWWKKRGQHAIKPQHHSLPRKTDERTFVKGTFRCVPTGDTVGDRALAEIAFTGVATGI
jgi:hypothetical protein